MRDDTAISSFAPHPVGAVANFMIGKSLREGFPITHLQLQKLVYISYGLYLALTGKRLFRERIEAWPLGPVIPELYHEFKRFGRKRIRRWSSNYDYDSGQFVWPLVSDDDRDSLIVLNFVWPTYGPMSGSELVDLTHQDGTPWSATQRGDVIEDALIRDHFLKLI